MPNFVREPEFKIPPEGISNSKCCDVIDLGPQKITWEGVEKIRNKHRLVFQVEGDDGKTLYVHRDYTSELYPQAALTLDLESWRDRQFTKEEKRQFDLDVLVGKPCRIEIVHNVRDGRTFANIAKLLPWPAGLKPPVTEPYIRKQDRESGKNGKHESAAEKKALDDFLKDDAAPRDGVNLADLPPSLPKQPGDDFVASDSDVPF